MCLAISTFLAENTLQHRSNNYVDRCWLSCEIPNLVTFAIKGLMISQIETTTLTLQQVANFERTRQSWSVIAAPVAKFVKQIPFGVKLTVLQWEIERFNLRPALQVLFWTNHFFMVSCKLFRSIIVLIPEVTVNLRSRTGSAPLECFWIVINSVYDDILQSLGNINTRIIVIWENVQARRALLFSLVEYARLWLKFDHSGISVEQRSEGTS